MKPLASGTIGLFGAISFLFVGFLRAEFLLHPLPEVASAGLPALVLSHVFAAVLIAVVGRFWLRPAIYLRRSVYSSEAPRRSLWEYLTIIFVILEQLGLVLIQQSVYSQALRAFSLFRTPRVVLGIIMVVPVYLIANLPTSRLIRAVQVFFYGQILLLPLMFLASRQWQMAQLRPFMLSPLSGLSLVPSTVYLYLCSCIMLVVGNASDAKVFGPALNWLLVVLGLTYVTSALLIAGSLGPRLLSISAFPAMKHLQGTRIPLIERFDLIVLFLLGNVAITASAVLAHTICLGLRVLGINQKVSLALVCLIKVYASTLRALPPAIRSAEIATLICAGLAVICVRLIPIPDKGDPK